MKKNPFVFGRIVNKNNFCNRKQEKAELKKNILNSYSVWLFAPRRYGKSSLIRSVFAELPQVKTIYFDLYNIQSLDDFCRKYSNILARELFDWKDDVKTITKQLQHFFKNLYPKVSFDESGTPSLSIEQHKIDRQVDVEEIINIPEKIARNKKQKICIAFDEFQEIERIDKFLINWMRSAFQQQEHVSYVFSGSKQALMQSIFSSVNSPFYEYAVKMDIGLINRSEWKLFIKAKFKGVDIIIKEKAIDEILDKSKCHPHFTQFFASVVYDFIIEGFDQEADDFAKLWMDSIIRSQSVVFQNIYDMLNNNQRKVLTALANNSHEIFSEAIRNRYDLPTSSSLNTTLNGLISKDIILKESNRYLISNPVFNEWIRLL